MFTFQLGPDGARFYGDEGTHYIVVKIKKDITGVGTCARHVINAVGIWDQGQHTKLGCPVKIQVVICILKIILALHIPTLVAGGSSIHTPYVCNSMQMQYPTVTMI